MNTMLTGNWKVTVLKFSEIENTVFFGAKKLMERWYLLNTEKFLFRTFQRWDIRFFLTQKVDGKMTFTDYWKVLVLSFSVVGNTMFFSAKKLMERWYLLGLFELSMIFQNLGNMAFRTVRFACAYFPYFRDIPIQRYWSLSHVVSY